MVRISPHRSHRRSTVLGALAIAASSVAVNIAAGPATASPGTSTFPTTVTLAYASSFARDTVSAIDTATNTVIATIPVGSGPEGVALTPDGRRAYVPNELSGTVSVIDTTTNTLAGTIPVGAMPLSVAITPSGTEAYVTDQASNSVSVIDLASNTVAATIAVGANPFGIAITPDGARAYVPNENAGTVSVIATATMTVTGTITVGTGPSYVAFSNDGARAYVSNLTSGTLSVVNVASGTVTSTIPVGPNPRGVVVTPDDRRAYVANATFSDFVSVVDLASATVTTTIPVGGVPSVLALDPDGAHAYVTNSGGTTVSVIDTVTNTAIANVTVGANAAGVGVGEVPTSGHISVFYARPSGDGSSVTIAGLVQNVPGTAYSLAVDATSSCSRVGAPEGVAPISVTTNSSGYAYFDDTFSTSSGVPSFVSVFSTAPLARSNCYPVGADNTAWENAVGVGLVGGAGSIQGQIAVPGESRWYKFQATPDSRVTVTLSGLSDDYAVSVYSDIGQASSSAPTSTEALNQLSAESASSTFSPSAFIPSAFIPSAFIPSAFIPSAFIPSAFIPSAFIPSAFIPSAFIPSNSSPSALLPGGFAPSAFSSSAFATSSYSPSASLPPPFSSSGVLPSALNPLSYSNALGRSVITYNDQGGLSAKTVTVNTWQSTGSFYIQVSGANGAHDTVNGFQLSVNSGSASCPSSVVPIGGPPPAAAGTGSQTVIVTDSSRLSGTAAAVSDVLSQLQNLANRPEVAGTVVDLAANSRVQALDAQADANPGCPFAKNLVAGAVKDVVNSYRANNPLRYVVVAGPDNAVPLFRHPDQTLMGNETGYVPPVADGSASQAALRLGYTLSDNDYGAKVQLASQSDTFPVPDLAVGRLVETASEISGMVQAYLATSGGVLPTPASSLVTGYDFLDYPAQSVESDLAAGTGQAPATLIAPRTQAPANSWTATDLKNAVLNSGRHDIVFLAGHFSADDTLAADYTTDMITTDMEQSTVNLYNALVFSAGCHSGYNIVNKDAVPNVTLTLDWPEEFARKQAILIGGTGYQFGDTDFTAYSEKIYADFAHVLRLGSGPVPIGQALLKAKQDYLTNTPDLDAMSQKAVYEATLYGLPMGSINMPSGRLPAPSDTSIVAAPTRAASGPGATLGLRSASVALQPTLTRNSLTVNDLTNHNAAVSATYVSGDNGVVAEPYQPVLPVESANVSVPGQSLRGAVFLGGSYTDTTGVTPLTGAPATEVRGVHTGFQSSVYFPERPWRIDYFDALDGNGTGATRLLTMPVQHISDPAPATTDTRRQYASMNFQLFYSSNTATYGAGATSSTPAAAGAPQILNVQSRPGTTPGTVDFCATIGDNPAVGVQAAYVTYTDPTAAAPAWSSLALGQGACSTNVAWNNLTPGDSTSWGGQVTLAGGAAAHTRFFVQAVSGAGLVSMDDNLGQEYALPTLPVTSSRSIVQNVTAGVTTAPFGTPVTVHAAVHTLLPGAGAGAAIGAPLVNVPVTFSVGTQSATAFTDTNGIAQATLALQLPPGSYPVSAAVTSTDGVIPSSADAAQPLAVTAQPTLLTLAPTGGSPAPGQTSYTATLCDAGGSASCGPTDAPVANRTVVFELSGAVTRTVASATNAAGQVQFNAFQLPSGSYTLHAYFDGTIPGVGTLTDAFYAPPAVNPVTATFASTATYTVAPKLTVPADIFTVQTGEKGTVVSYVVHATDPVDPRPNVSCLPGSTTLFPVGTTTVSCQATDTAGLTSTGSFTITVAPLLAPGTTTCSGPLGGTGKNVVVPGGATCTLVAGTAVTGNISVQPGGSLRTIGGTVGGNVTLDGASASMLCDLTVGHNLAVTDAPSGTGTTVVGDTAEGCASGDTIAGNVVITGNKASVDVGSSSVGTTLRKPGGGHVTAAGNTALLTLQNDQIGASLSVSDRGPVVIRNCTVNGKPVG